jgi:hypothetical protein
MFVSNQNRWIAGSSKAVRNQNLISLLKFRQQQTVKHVVEADVANLSSVPLSHARASQQSRTP